MNKKQYLVTSIFLFILPFYTLLMKTFYINKFIFSYQVFETYIHIVDAGVLFIVLLAFPLAFLFFILGRLEEK